MLMELRKASEFVVHKLAVNECVLKSCAGIGDSGDSVRLALT